LCIPTFYGTLDTTFEEKRTSVPAFSRVFTGGVPLGYGVQRRDIEVRFPLSRKAFLTLTHDLKLIGILEKADRRKRENMVEHPGSFGVSVNERFDYHRYRRGQDDHAK
jgi:hypothetical protein